MNLYGQIGLLDVDDAGGVLLLLFESDGEDAILQLGFDGSLFFLDLDRKSDGAGEFAPVAFLNVPSGGIFVFTAAEDAGNGKDVVGNGNIKVGFRNASGAGFDN